MEKTTTPGFYIKKEWRKLFEKLSNEETGMIIKNMFRLDEEEELLEMTLAAEMFFDGTIAPTQEFNKIKYEKKISANKENGAKGGAPSGNQNARKTTQINPKQHKDIDKDIDKEKGIVKEIVIDKNKEIGRVIEKAKSLTNNENSSIDNSSLHSIESLYFDKEKVEKNQENISNQNITNNNRNNSLPPGAITVAEYYRNQGKL